MHMPCFLKCIKLRTIHQKILMAFVLASLMTGAVVQNLLTVLDLTVSDALYQQRAAFSGEVVLIGIDSNSLNEYGVWPWTRDVMAMAFEALNSDTDLRPAAIGVDVLYIDPSDPYDDAFLVEMASIENNIVLACKGEFGTYFDISEDGMTVMRDDYRVTKFEQPFPALRDVTHIGTINSMYDPDSRLRHALWQIDLPDGTVVPSFAQEMARLYAEFHGVERKTPPLDLLGRYFLKFTGKPGQIYDGYGVADLINGEIDPEWYAGKVVLIGPYDATLKDAFMTAADHGAEMNGVEYQANIVEMLLTGNFKEEFPDIYQLIALFAAIFGLSFWYWDRKILPSTVVWIVLVSGWLGLCVLLFNYGIVLHPLWFPVGITIVYIASIAANYIRAAIEKYRVTNTFKKYVAPEIVAEILKEGSDAMELGGKMTGIAVLFVDIRGFTPMSEALSAIEIVEILNRYLALTSHCILQNRGTLDKFIGDATMAFWGAPLPQDDYIYKAVKTGMDMIDMSHDLGAELMEKYGRTVSFGIGVHCGPAVVGNIGAVNRMDYTAIGDTVNTAARLESNAPSNQLLISRTVADALEGRIKCTSLGDSIKLKGKAAGFEILKVDKLL